MIKEFVPYELAVKLKALGFDEPCFARFNNDGDLLIAHTEKYIIDNGVDRSEFFTLAPLFQQAFRWFRKKEFLIDVTSLNSNEYEFYIQWSFAYSHLSDIYKTYEEAELACLDKLIEIVETKQQEQ
jgi:hypothetical protein